MADSKKTNFTYRVNTKTPQKVREWLERKPDGLSYPEFVNAAILLACNKEGDSDLDLDAITDSLSEMVAKQSPAPTLPSGGGASISPGEIADAIAPAVKDDGALTRSHIDEVAGQLSEQIGSIATASHDQQGVNPSLGIADSPTDHSGADPDAIADAVSSAVSESVRDTVSHDGEQTRETMGAIVESVERVDKGVSDILGIIQSSSVDAAVTPEADASTNVIPDGQLTEDDLNFAVQRIKDTIRTDGQKTRNAIITKLEQNATEDVATPDEPVRQGLTSEDMQAICDLIKQSNQTMIESLQEKIEVIQQAEAQGSRDIVFDEATTSFFKRIHNSVASILIRVDAMQAQLEHIQKMVERNGNTLKGMAKPEAPDGRVVLPGGDQFGDAMMFMDAPEIEELGTDDKWEPKKAWEQEQDVPRQIDAEDGNDTDDGNDDVDDDTDAHVAVDSQEDGGKSVPMAEVTDVATDSEQGDSDETQEPLPQPPSQSENNGSYSASSIEILSNLLGNAGNEATKTPIKRPRISVPRRRHAQHPVAQADDDQATDAGSQDRPRDERIEIQSQDEADSDDIMQPTGRIPVASPAAESVESIIDGLDLNRVGAVSVDPDELLTDTLQSLLG